MSREATNTTSHQLLVEFRAEPSLRYTKIDMTRACRVDNEFAVTFFQFDYQQLANTLVALEAKQGPSTVVEARPVHQLVMTEKSFKQLIQELLRIAAAANVNLEEP